jgi:hypothetical protein
MNLVLSPLYTYALYHPIRFLLTYLILPLPSLILFLLISLVQLILSLFKSLFYPIYISLQFITFPARVALRFLNALMPVWIFLGTAVIIGCIVGAMAGLLLGGTTRKVVEKGFDLFVWPLRIVGFVEPSRVGGGRGREEAFGANGGARIEAIPRRRKERLDKKGKGKVVDRGGGKEEEFQTTTDEEEEERDSSTFVGSNSSFGRNGLETNSRRRRGRKAYSMGSSSNSSSSEEEEEQEERIGIDESRRGGKDVKSGWRKRHVQDVLQ